MHLSSCWRVNIEDCCIIFCAIRKIVEKRTVAIFNKFISYKLFMTYSFKLDLSH